jgi:hypothetical protein
LVADRWFLASQAAEPSGKYQLQRPLLSNKRMNLYPGGQGMLNGFNLYEKHRIFQVSYFKLFT